MSSLFIDSSKQPKGIVDIGANCYYCNQLDLLPFDCEYCNHKFCSNHRTLESHKCINKDKSEKSDKSAPTSSGFTISSASLFPDRNKDKLKLNQSLNNPKPTTIKETQFRVGDVIKSNAFTKFRKFLKIQDKSKSKLFKKSTKFTDVAILKKQAKGDVKININDRIYIWCVYIQDPDVKLDVGKVKKPLFINKNWSIGKSLDSICDTLLIRNQNNITNNAEEKLNIFKLNDKEEPELMKSSLKSSTFKTGDLIYLVKGVI
ncbi:unnamed protein product [Candida verbasci]|uniref:AN1-type domain-containing protein n=1 Tax=Candida verbasci TaxID=1227364 RepID=A0A9W4X9V8_9ASCO|nr:unnamed protein product [Candida verbasci]